ncbi:hypothetical protein CL614_00455 [archaeon]|nr:hypothetical protein [archaeon]|tara:strand:+ start:893 stop:1552 length:660 start_codon:yes stop_codon:yes gene_type:complete
MTSKVTVIVPAFNERRHIQDVLERIPKKYNIIVVDDGSTDGTAFFVNSLGYKVVRFERNRGKARACKAGVETSNTELNVLIDGDGQLMPEEIPIIVDALKHNDLVLGARNMRFVPRHRKITNWLARRAIHIITGKSFQDALCGFRGIKKSKFQSLKLNHEGYMFETDLIIQSMKHKHKIESIPVKVSYNIGSRMPWPASVRLAGKLIKESFKHVLGAEY